MGTEVVNCCTQTLITEEDDGENSESNIGLSDTAKCLYEINDNKSNKYNHLNVPYNKDNKAEIINDLPLGLPRKRASSLPKESRNKSKKSKRASIKKYKKKQLREQRRSKRSMSVEEELDATEIELKQQEHAIKLLKKQNEFLRKQNEEFILKYGSYFACSPNITSPEKLTTETSINSNHSDDTPNIDNLSQISQISYSNGYDLFGTTIQTQPTPEAIDLDLAISLNTDQLITNNINNTNNKPISPLTPLTNKQTSIILSYSNTSNTMPFAPILNSNNTEIISFPDTKAISNNNARARSCSVPVFSDESSAHKLQNRYSNHSNKDGTVNLYGNDNKCDNVSSCKSIKRIIITLQWYSLCDGDHDVLSKKIMESKYDKYLLNDYQHIINGHLIHENEINRNKEYKLIQTEINKQIKACDIKTCNGYKRYNQLSKKKNLSISEYQQFSMEFMDLIHCHLMHSHNLQ